MGFLCPCFGIQFCVSFLDLQLSLALPHGAMDWSSVCGCSKLALANKLFGTGLLYFTGDSRGQNSSPMSP